MRTRPLQSNLPGSSFDEESSGDPTRPTQSSKNLNDLNFSKDKRLIIDFQSSLRSKNALNQCALSNSLLNHSSLYVAPESLLRTTTELSKCMLTPPQATVKVL